MAAMLLSERITQPATQEVQDNLRGTHDQILGAGQKSSLRTRVESALHRYESALVGLPHKAEHMARQLARHLAVVLFEVFVFPLTPLVALLGLGRLIVRQAVGVLSTAFGKFVAGSGSGYAVWDTP